LNLYSKKLNALLIGAIFLTCYLILFSYSLGPVQSFDVFWHLQLGQDLLEKNLSPWVDHYSFTHYQNEISSTPVLFQVYLATLVSIFGEVSGFIAFKLIYITLLFFTIYYYLKQVKAPWFIVALILPVLTYFIFLRLIIRPELITNILLILLLSFYLQARNNFTTKELLKISLLLLFWVNYHSPILGYIVIFGLFLDRAIHKIVNNEKEIEWQQWFIWGLIIFSIGFLNPSFEHSTLNYAIDLAFSTPSEWSKYISEYAPSYDAYATNKMVNLLWFSSFFIIGWCLMKGHYGFAIIALLLIYFSWSTIRLIPVAGIIHFSILALLLSKIDYSTSLNNIRPSLRYILFLSFPIFVVYTISQKSDHTLTRLKVISNYNQHTEHMRTTLEKRHPAQLVDYLNSFHDGGNILNTFNTGGYLLHNLSTNYKIYIDGRTNILYPIEFYEHYLEVISNTETLEEEIKKYNIKYAIFENTKKAHYYFSGVDNFTVNFANKNFILFSNTKDVAFPVASKLTIFPICWNDNLATAVSSEISLSKTLFSDKSYTIKSILEVLDGYLSNDKNQYLNSLKHENFAHNSTKRLIAILALNTKNHEVATLFFKSITIKNNSDFLMLAYSLGMSKNFATSRTALNIYIKNKGGLNKNLISDFDKAIILKTLIELLNNDDSQEVNTLNINEIRAELGINDELFTTSAQPGLPYNPVCNPIFKSNKQ